MGSQEAGTWCRGSPALPLHPCSACLSVTWPGSGQELRQPLQPQPLTSGRCHRDVSKFTVTTITSITTTVTTMASATPRHPRPRQGLTRRPVCPMGPRDLDRPISRTRKPRVNEASEKPARASCSLEKAKLGFRPPESLCPETCDLVTPSRGLAAPVKGVAPSQGYRGGRMGPEGFRDKRLLPPPGTSPV